jgi:hypothetical protein
MLAKQLGRAPDDDSIREAEYEIDTDLHELSDEHMSPTNWLDAGKTLPFALTYRVRRLRTISNLSSWVNDGAS